MIQILDCLLVVVFLRLLKKKLNHCLNTEFSDWLISFIQNQLTVTIFAYMADDFDLWFLKWVRFTSEREVRKPLKSLESLLRAAPCRWASLSVQTSIRAANRVFNQLTFPSCSSASFLRLCNSWRDNWSTFHTPFLSTSISFPSLFLTSIVDLTCPNLLGSPALFRRSLSWLSFDVTQAESSENLQTHK